MHLFVGGSETFADIASGRAHAAARPANKADADGAAVGHDGVGDRATVPRLSPRGVMTQQTMMRGRPKGEQADIAYPRADGLGRMGSSTSCAVGHGAG